MPYWEGPSRWINTALIVIVSFVGLDTLFRLLSAREENVIVGGVRWVANVFLFPFADMFEEQHFLLTAIIALIGYSVLAIVAVAIIRSVQASRRDRARQQAIAPRQAPAQYPPTERLTGPTDDPRRN